MISTPRQAACATSLSFCMLADRDENFQSVSTTGLYPAGEGAGYAGGIVSAAVDGLRVGRAVASDLAAVH